MWISGTEWQEYASDLGLAVFDRGVDGHALHDEDRDEEIEDAICAVLDFEREEGFGDKVDAFFVACGSPARARTYVRWAWEVFAEEHCERLAERDAWESLDDYRY